MLASRGIKLWACITIAFLVAATGALIRNVYVDPNTSKPLQPADAVVVLGGATYERFRYGIQLAEEGLAPQVLISNSAGPRDPVMTRICDTPARVSITCFLPVPWTTRGEAQEIRTVAAERGWRSIILVTSTDHLYRARYIVGRCFTGQIQLATYPQTRGISELLFAWAYQTGGWLRALTQNGC
ncbi:YdcF family protein [Skermania sp. ID1734]|nr:YdcF family protein [Skermania sp. ID1734]